MTGTTVSEQAALPTRGNTAPLVHRRAAAALHPPPPLRRTLTRSSALICCRPLGISGPGLSFFRNCPWLVHSPLSIWLPTASLSPPSFFLPVGAGGALAAGVCAGADAAAAAPAGPAAPCRCCASVRGRTNKALGSEGHGNPTVHVASCKIRASRHFPPLTRSATRPVSPGPAWPHLPRRRRHPTRQSPPLLPRSRLLGPRRSLAAVCCF
jgi:hypothetical protein